MNELLHIDLTQADLEVLTSEQAWRFRVIPKGKGTDFFVDESYERSKISELLEASIGKRVTLDPLPKEEIEKLLSKFYKKESKKIGKTIYRGKPDEFLSDLISEAKNLKSSDIHIESYKDRCRVRIRIDGMLIERYELNKDEYPSLINRIKIMAGLDIAEKRLPQDGRISFKRGKFDQFDIRVSVVPTIGGGDRDTEKIVLRILSNDTARIDLNSLGLSPDDMKNILTGIRKPHGLVLISGPTGSGKTTTLFAALKLLNKETRNILTIEDPVEYVLEGVNQVQLREAIGLTFGSALRTFLRQDPDVIMVGEIRDPDTASMAIRTALTGHLVLSTVHTNSAWGIVSRLIDMGVEGFTLASTLNTAIAQRLVRLLCSACKHEIPFDAALYPQHFTPYREITNHFIPAENGCAECHGTGYKSRKAVYEVIPIDAELSQRIKNNVFDISEDLKKRKIKTLAENAFGLFESGETSLEEIYSLLNNY